MREGAVCALAGRRIDADDAEEERFPLGRVEEVRQRIKAALVEEGIGILVCSAACGADLLALEEAGKLGLRRWVVLPFSKDKFKETSVTDRPGEWGQIYRDIIAEVERAGDLLVLAGDEKDEKSYKAATDAILAEASRVASEQHRETVVMVVWEGHGRGSSDETASLLEQASSDGFRVREIRTV